MDKTDAANAAPALSIVHSRSGQVERAKIAPPGPKPFASYRSRAGAMVAVPPEAE
jgi:hypothetical protein